jgi:FolB domain-containing protein
MSFPILHNDHGQVLDQVQVKGMLLTCVLGIFPFERERKQPISVDLCLYTSTSQPAKSESIHDALDYAAVVQELTFILEQGAFLLIETALESVANYFLLGYGPTTLRPHVEAVAVRLSKPTALTQGVIPTIQILRRRSAATTSSSNTDASMLLHRSKYVTLRLWTLQALQEMSPIDFHKSLLLNLSRLHATPTSINAHTQLKWSQVAQIPGDQSGWLLELAKSYDSAHPT